MRNGIRPIPSLILRRRPRRRGFTLLELTVVIGIILVLLSMAVVGYRHLEASAARNRTRVALHDAEAMLAEMDRTGGMIRIEGPNGLGALYVTGATVSSPGDVTSGGPGRTTANTNCTNLLGILVQAPPNQQAVAQLPVKSLVAGSIVSINGVQVSAIADGWGNPIIFVPSGGLLGPGGTVGITINGKPLTNPNGTPMPITSPDHRPFFASAGPDGNFTTGEDNMYSFER